jgi:phospholipid/cholesterol/gamma-HCH transport system substrate-binding protein
MEPTRSLEIKVGIFVAAAVALTTAFILALGGDKGLFHRTYILKMQAEESGGLSAGSVVQVAGIQCGNVIAVAFEGPGSTVTINMKIDRKFQERITVGSTAAILTQGALGDKYIMIKPGPAGESVKDGGLLSAEPSTDLLSTLGKSGHRVERIFEIMDEAEKLLKGLNDRSFSQNLSETAKNLKDATFALNEVMSSVRGSDPNTNKLKRALEHLNSIMEKIDDGQGTLGGLINDPTVHQDLKTILGGAKRSKLLQFLIHQATKGGEEAEKDKDKEPPSK